MDAAGRGEHRLSSDACFVPPIIAIREGQVAGFLLLALVAAFVGFARRNAVIVGGALAFATHLKLLPIVFCLYLGWRKQWIAATVAALFLVGLVLTVPPIFGIDALVSYIQNFQATAVFGQLFPRLANQSIAGLWARMLLPYLERSTIYWVYLSSVVVIVVATISLCWPMRDLPRTWRYEYALILCALLLIPPFIWYHMLTLLLIPLAVVVEYLWRKQQWQLLALLGVLYLATDVHGVIYRHVAIPVGLSSFPLALVLYVWGMLAWMIVEARRSEADV